MARISAQELPKGKKISRMDFNYNFLLVYINIYSVLLLQVTFKYIEAETSSFTTITQLPYLQFYTIQQLVLFSSSLNYKFTQYASYYIFYQCIVTLSTVQHNMTINISQHFSNLGYQLVYLFQTIQQQSYVVCVLVDNVMQCILI